MQTRGIKEQLLLLDEERGQGVGEKDEFHTEEVGLSL